MLNQKEQDYECIKFKTLLYYPTTQTSKRGSALLAVVLILAFVSSVMSIGTAKITQVTINSTGANKATLQAQQSASSEADLISHFCYNYIIALHHNIDIYLLFSLLL